MSSLSLDASIRTCKVQTGNADRIQTDRFFNPNNMVCIPWNGYNNKGQSVSPDSQYTKTAGCNSAEDRVSVETFLRPDYAAYINLNMQGLQGDIYGNSNATDRAGQANEWQDSRNAITGQFGNQWQSTNYKTCSISPGAYETAMAQISQDNRQAAASNIAFKSNMRRQEAGFGGCRA